MFNRWLHPTTTTTVLRPCQGLPGWAGTRRNIHPLTPILISTILYQLPPSTMIHGNLPVQFMCFFVPPLCKSSLVYLLIWDPQLHTSYISSPNHLLFATHGHTIATGFAAVPRSYHLFLVSPSSLYSEINQSVSELCWIHTWVTVFAVRQQKTIAIRTLSTSDLLLTLNQHHTHNIPYTTNVSITTR